MLCALVKREKKSFKAASKTFRGVSGIPEMAVTWIRCQRISLRSSDSVYLPLESETSKDYIAARIRMRTILA